MTQQQEALFKFCLRLGDDALIHSYRLSEWCSNAPILEEDLALTNFALDMIGRAQAILAYAGQIEGKGRTEDMLAYRRSEREYFNHLIVEQPDADFAHAITKMLFVAAYEYQLYSEIAKCTDATLSGIAAKTLKEIKYHLEHATDWALRLGDGTAESHERMQDAVNDLWMYTGELFEADETEAAMTTMGLTINELEFHKQWLARISAILGEATLSVPENVYMQTGGRDCLHTEHLGHILSEMQYLQRAYPDAAW